ncbi:MAG: DUF4292 domain-containing protein [Flavobacteriales bacterium]|jgi:hypothetical protein|nr:DUF4292 domain-containing protein [Flavobacteriales bacterium]
MSLLSLLAFESCNIFKSKEKKEREKIYVKFEELNKKLTENHKAFKTLEIKGKLVAKKPIGITLRQTMRIQNNEKIWISATFLGMEVLRAKIDQKEISLLDKKNKKNYVLNFEKWNKKYHTNYNIQHFQKLILGQILNPISKNSSYEINDNSFKISQANEHLKMTYFIENAILNSQSFADFKGKMSASFQYSDNFIEGFIPEESLFELQTKSIYKGSLVSQSVKVDSEISMPFKVSSKYEKIEL